MDFFDPKKKRAHRIRLFIGYGLVATALAIATLILVFAANGYDLDPKTGTVLQNGLVFVDSHPVSATVYVDGHDRAQTDTRLVIPAGQHNLEIKRDGYRDWQRQFDLEGGSVRRFAYPFLFPKNLVTKDVKIYDTLPGMSSETPDRHWLLVQQPNSLTNFETVDLNTKTNPVTTISLPSSLFNLQGNGHTLESVEWSTDNRHILIKHNFDGGSEFVVVDREIPADSINLNKLFQIPMTSVTLKDKRFDQYYVYDANGGVLRSAEVRNKLITPMLTHVLAYKPYGANVVLFVTDENSPAGQVKAKIWDNQTVYDLRQMPTSGKYLIDLTQFGGNWYMAVGNDTEKKTYIYKNAFDALKSKPAKKPLPISVLKVTSPEYMSFSTNARFIEVQGGSEFAVYDAENNEQFRYNTKLNLLSGQKANWMDGHRLIVISQNKEVVFDFDGTNLQTLGDASPAHLVFFDREYNAMFTIANSRQTSLKPGLVRTELKVLQASQ